MYFISVVESQGVFFGVADHIINKREHLYGVADNRHWCPSYMSDFR